MKQILIVISTGLIFLFSFNLMAGELSGREIMELVDSRDDGKDRTSEMTMTLINRRGRTRVRKIRSFSKDYGEDRKQVMIFEKPADVRGTGFLSWEYEDESQEDDRWLYMPAMRKVRRISGSSSNDYFMGSDFTYDDMGDSNIDEYTYTFLREELLCDKQCWIVKSLPVDKDEIYDHKIIWVNKETNMVVKVEFYDDIGLMKTLEMQNIALIDGIWTAQKMIMDNHREEHQTILDFENISYNQELKDNIFTVAAIQRGRL